MDDRSPLTSDVTPHPPATTSPSSSRDAAETAGFFAVLEAVLGAAGIDPQSNPPPAR
jgi:hypothetical protein